MLYDRLIARQIDAAGHAARVVATRAIRHHEICHEGRVVGLGNDIFTSYVDRLSIHALVGVDFASQTEVARVWIGRRRFYRVGTARDRQQ